MPETFHIHYARTLDDMVFGEELRQITLDHPSYHLIAIATADHPRRFSGVRLDELVPDWRERAAWACGPHSLLTAVEAAFECAARGHALAIERFRAPVVTIPDDARGGVVRFGASGVTARADARTPLLQLAETAGLAPPHGCRMGICHSCDTTMVSGCVRDLRTGARIDEPGARIQICVCVTEGDVELVL
jgi:ferredoxin